MPALWHLNLADNALRGRLPTALAQPAPLVLLDLSGNRIGGLLNTQLSQFPDLSRVNLARNRLRGSLPESLQDLPYLRHLDLSGNRFTGAIPAALETHAGLLAGAATGDAAVLLDWNPLSAGADSIAWLDTVGTNPDTLVGPVTGLQLDDVSDPTQLRWKPQPFPPGTEGYYRIESAAGEEIARTTDLSVGHVALDANLEVDATELRVVTVLPAHDSNPNAVEGPASSPHDTDPVLWTPASVSHPVNHGPFEQPAWAVVSESVLVTITEVATPDLFSEQPDVSTDGTLRFTPASRVGTSRVVATVRENGATRTLEFDITVGESANRAPTFRPGENVTVDALGSMQVVEWASALDDGDNGTQSMQFVLDNPSPDWFAVQPELSVPSGTLRFRFNPGQTGSVTLSVRLEDNGGTDNGGVDRSPSHALTLTASEAGQGVGGAGVASDATGTGGGAAFGLLWLGVMARRRRPRHLGQ